MEVAEVEFVAELGLGFGSQFLDLQFADFVGEGLAGRCFRTATAPRDSPIQSILKPLQSTPGLRRAVQLSPAVGNQRQATEWPFRLLPIFRQNTESDVLREEDSL